jgi:hypothetical protein
MPADCDDQDACTTDSVAGDADSCSAECANDPVTACNDDDGCCPNNCDASTDNDCSATCGDGNIDANETCDGNCPQDVAECDDSDACTTDVLNGSAMNCTAECVNDDITMCIDGDGCCAPGCDATNDDDCAPICGNDITEPTETCDGNCPADCDDGNACTTETMSGSAANCDVECTYDDITSCTDDDGCCPMGCNATNDNDCSATCGNGTVEMGETCDGNCPSDCDDSNSCTVDSMTGSAGNCNVVCSNEAITMCIDGDGCCAAGCTANDDDDCSATCGNNVVEPGEACDGNCPADCDDGVACTIDGSTGTAQNCSLQCTHTDINNCVDGDGCCAPGCTNATDNDCQESEPIGAACGSGGDCASGACFGDPVTDGYCSQGCLDDGDCPNGTHCGFFDAGIGVCLDNCNADGDCRQPDYECFDADSDVTDECWAVGSGAGQVGDACAEHGDCAGGQDGWCIHDSLGWKNGYCTREFTAADPCPAGSHRTFFDSTSGTGICAKDCGSSGDCRDDGYLCFDADGDAVTECAAAATGSGQIGEPCQELYDCAGDEDGFCFTQDDGWRDGYCSQACNATTACPNGSHCSDADGDGEGVCVDDCLGSGQCRFDGYLCLDFDDSGDDECFPAATGTGQVGDGCNGYWECAGGEFGACITDAGWTEGYCTIFCGAGESTCPVGSECFAFNDADACLDNCMTQVDCRTGYSCQDQGLTENVCAP